MRTFDETQSVGFSTPEPRPAAPPSSNHKLIWGSAGLAAAAAPISWLWQGYLARGAVTLMTSQWKAGKTTLASVLLARLKTGGQIAGLDLAAAKAIVVTEESPDLWQNRQRHLDFADEVGWYCRPFNGKPTLPQWLDFVDELAELHTRIPYSLLVIDPLAAFLAGSENDAGSVLECLAPLQRLGSRNVSSLVLHHPKKNDPPLGQAARGSGAISGFADILIEMRPGRRERRRQLCAWSRYPQTPARYMIEWTADGTDYLVCPSFQDEEFARRWHRVQAVFAEAPHKLTRTDVLLRWPDKKKKPDKVALRRWLEKAVADGLLRKDGNGRRNQPFRYWLPEREEVWRQDPLACCLMPELRETPRRAPTPTEAAPGAPAGMPDSPGH